MLLDKRNGILVPVSMLLKTVIFLCCKPVVEDFSVKAQPSCDGVRELAPSRRRCMHMWIVMPLALSCCYSKAAVELTWLPPYWRPRLDRLRRV